MPSVLDPASGLDRVACPACDGTGSVVPDVVLADELRRRRLDTRPRLAGREVARRMGISTAYLTGLELGRHVWSRALVLRYEAALEGKEEE